MKKMIVLTFSALLAVPGFAANIQNVSGKLYATGFTGRAADCETAEKKAEEAVRLYCQLVSQNYTCGDVETEDNGGDKTRCAVRVRVELSKKSQ